MNVDVAYEIGYENFYEGVPKQDGAACWINATARRAYCVGWEAAREEDILTKLRAKRRAEWAVRFACIYTILLIILLLLWLIFQ